MVPLHGLCIAMFALFMNTQAGGDSRIVIARSAGAVTLSGGPVRVPLQAEGGESVAARLRALAPERHVYVVLRGLSAATAPGTAFLVYVNQPANGGRESAGAGGFRAGRFSLFEEIRDSQRETPATFRSFDVTPLVKRLLADGQLTEPLTVTIIPERTLAPASKPVIERIELIAG